MGDAEHDERMVMGTACSWWGPIDKVARRRPGDGGIRTCPKCGGVLQMFEDAASFWSFIDAYDAEFPGYRGCVEWLKGRCFPTMGDAAEAYEKERADAGASGRAGDGS